MSNRESFLRSRGNPSKDLEKKSYLGQKVFRRDFEVDGIGRIREESRDRGVKSFGLFEDTLKREENGCQIFNGGPSFNPVNTRVE